MGIDTDAHKIVTFTTAHEHGVVTDPMRPIPKVRYGRLEVVSIFRRRTVPHDKGDGNPLIYALKSKFGYTMPYRDRKLLYRAAARILPDALAGADYDLVVPLPSAANIAALLATRAARQRPGCDVIPCLDKASIGQVLSIAPDAEQVRRQHRGAYTSQLATLQRLDPASIIQMKSVDNAVRPYFAPVVANSLAAKCAGRHVLLVDDILSSGSSLAAAESALHAAGAASIHALTLLSRLR